jgi:hypothetical protein
LLAWLALALLDVLLVLFVSEVLDIMLDARLHSTVGTNPSIFLSRDRLGRDVMRLAADAPGCVADESN